MGGDTLLPSHSGKDRSTWRFWSSSDGDATPPPPPARAPSMASKPMAPLGPPPKPPPPPPDIVSVYKPRGVPLGVRFFSDAGTSGAEVERVDEHGLAWRAGLAWGDTIEGVSVYSRSSGTLLSEHKLSDGFDAAKALRPAAGRIELAVRRRRRTPSDLAATKIEAAVRGTRVRAYIRASHHLATIVACHWRGAQARRVAARRRAALGRRQRASRRKTLMPAERAAIHIQAAWRRFEAMVIAYEQRLALVHIQQHVRGWLATRVKRGGASRRTPRPSRPVPVRNTIRAPARLIDDEDDDVLEVACMPAKVVLSEKPTPLGRAYSETDEDEEESEEEESEEEESEYEEESEEDEDDCVVSPPRSTRYGGRRTR